MYNKDRYLVAVSPPVEEDRCKNRTALGLEPTGAVYRHALCGVQWHYIADRRGDRYIRSSPLRGSIVKTFPISQPSPSNGSQSHNNMRSG